MGSIEYGGVAQLARACGSYPQCPGFESLHRYHVKPGKWELTSLPFLHFSFTAGAVDILGRNLGINIEVSPNDRKKGER